MATVADPPSAAEPIVAAEDQLEEITKLALFIGKTVDANPAVPRWSLIGANSERVELPEAVFQLLRLVVETLARTRTCLRTCGTTRFRRSTSLRPRSRLRQTP